MTFDPKQTQLIRSRRSELRSAEAHWRATEKRERQRRIEKVKHESLSFLAHVAIGTFFGAVIGLAIRWSH